LREEEKPDPSIMNPKAKPIRTAITLFHWSGIISKGINGPIIIFV